jgi:outer membrane protein W
MKKNKIILFAMIALFAGTFTTSAQQGEVRMTASLAGATPMGDFKDLVDKTSFRGADINIIYGINDKLGAGLNIGFQDFYQKFPRAVYKLSDGSDISAVITNSIQTIPFLATAKYNFKSSGIQPYASAGIGGSVVLNRQYLGEAANDFNKISFAARPALGIYIPFKKDGEVGVNIAANYTYIPYKEAGVSNLSYFGFTVGVGFPMRN